MWAHQDRDEIHTINVLLRNFIRKRARQESCKTTNAILASTNAVAQIWADGQTLEVCLDGSCELFDDPTNSGAVTASLPGDGVYQLSVTPVGPDGVREPVSGSIN